MPLPQAEAPLIFVAEDDPLMLDLITTRLKLAGYWTAQAREGWEAVHRIQEMKPKAVLLDVNLPGLSGFQVLRTLRDGGPRGIGPVMMLTARNSESDLRTAIALGAKDYMTKPFEDARMLQRVERLLRIGARRPSAAPSASVIV
ncbi:MAG TPA: response regulator [Caulobacter sp.]|nr:response regulator [Caulobacter sp.]